MAKINGMMDVGRRGLMLSQTAMQTTSHNITNKSTEGYSRQKVDLKTNPAINEGHYQLGTGAKLAGISRVNNPWIEKQLERENSVLKNMDQRAQGLNRLEAAVNEQNVKRLNDSISNFFNAFRDLSNNPESAVSRTQVREASVGLVKAFQETKRLMEDVKTDMNKNIEFNITEVNGIAKEIADLNQKIQQLEINGSGTANDERDHRDALIKKLSENIDISYAEDPKSGMINVSGGPVVLVAGTSSSQLKAVENERGQMRVQHELTQGGAALDITEQFKKGKVGAALDIRDNVTESMVQNLETLAFNLTNEVNKAHYEGYDRHGMPGVKFFESADPNQPFKIDNIKVSSEIMKDISRIAAAAQPNAEGDNTVANVIQNLQLRPMMEEGKYTFDDFYNAKVSEIGVLTQRANSALESQKNSFDQLQNIRESISGVNMDEEAAKMIEYQKSFEASARLIRTADEMFDTVLSLKRL